MRPLVPTSLTALLLLASCAARAPLTPAPEARVLPGREAAAVASVGEARVTADASAWDGYPSPLEGVVPVKVRVENAGRVPLRLRADAFSLRLAGGTSLTALAPHEVQGSVVVTRPPPTPSLAFPASPSSPGWKAPFFTGGDVPEASGDGPSGAPRRGWRGIYTVNSYLDDPGWSSRPVALPSPDMVSRALPEGVLEPGATAEGFIYFQGLPADAQRATLQVELVDAQGGAPLGRAELPFEYRGR